jgi:hypothetical protein
MAAPELLEIISVCEEMLARQDRLISTQEKGGRDTSDTMRLRTQIMDLLGGVQDTTREFESCERPN